MAANNVKGTSLLEGRIIKNYKVIKMIDTNHFLLKCISCGNEVIKNRGALYNDFPEKCSVCFPSTIKNKKMYLAWLNMRNRCNNPKNSEYMRYGGRGIKVCNEWEKSFGNFYRWAIKNGYKDELSIDRIDNNKGYSPENCRWATFQQQVDNRECSVILEYKGEKKNITTWAKEKHIAPKYIKKELKKGRTFEEILEKRKPIKKFDKEFDNKIIELYNKNNTVNQICEILNVYPQSVRERLDRHGILKIKRRKVG